MTASFRNLIIGLFCVIVCVIPAQAHPHVWVTMHTELVYTPVGRMTGVRHAWAFDDMFSAFATQGLESKEKGKFTREELAPLAKVNVESLKENEGAHMISFRPICFGTREWDAQKGPGS